MRRYDLLAVGGAKLDVFQVVLTRGRQLHLVVNIIDMKEVHI